MTAAPAVFERFVGQAAQALDRYPDEADRLAAIGEGLEALVGADDWLGEPWTRPHADRYAQHLLHLDPAARFCVVSFAWGPGQGTPVHDHTVWGLVGVLRGAEISQTYAADGVAPPRPLGPPRRLGPGEVEAVSPRLGDVHQVRNALDDAISVSIHLYGADIGSVRRWIYPGTGGRRPFVSGYADAADAPPFRLSRAA